MKKTRTQIQKEIEKLIDKLELGYLKNDLLNDLRINYRLESFTDEDYSQLGNSRFGGLPDLPKNLGYPRNEDGYFNLLCQINFSDFKDKLDKLPQKGILYIFDGHSSENDFVVFYSESTDNLEKKYPPKGLKNLNAEYNENTYDGIKVNFALSHYFSGDTIWKVYEHNEEKYDRLVKTDCNYNSEILTDSMDGVSHAYLRLKGFDTLVSSLDPDCYNLQNILDTIDENMTNPLYINEFLIRKKEQILKFDTQKEIHFKNMEKVTCLIGLESLDRLGWQWSDNGYKYVYILDEDLEKGNFNNLFVQTWSS